MTIRPLRRAIQLGMVALLIAIPLLNLNGISLISGTLYSLAIGSLWITDPAIGLQTILTTRAVDLTLLISLLLPILLTLVFGRIFCGWLCPQNTLSELVDTIASRFGLQRLFNPPPLSPRPRYVVLGILLFGSALAALPLLSLFSAPGILSVQVAKFVFEHRVGPELGLIGAILLIELFVVRRAWCNYLCPVGSVLGLFGTRRTLKIVFCEGDGRFCSHCQACTGACQLGLDPVIGHLYPQCHNCGDCLDACKIVKGKKPLAFRWDACGSDITSPPPADHQHDRSAAGAATRYQKKRP